MKLDDRLSKHHPNHHHRLRRLQTPSIEPLKDAKRGRKESQSSISHQNRSGFGKKTCRPTLK